MEEDGVNSRAMATKVVCSSSAASVDSHCRGNSLKNHVTRLHPVVRERAENRAVQANNLSIDERVSHQMNATVVLLLVVTLE